jgi:hypothetical protein
MKQLSLLILVSVFTFTACKKEGTGGKSSVSGTVKHHAIVIPNAVVYIKYGATEFPGADVSVYDASVVANASAQYEFKELQKGDYYIYGVGFDSSQMQTVTGGIGIFLKKNEAKKTDVPVTEP